MAATRKSTSRTDAEPTISRSTGAKPNGAPAQNGAAPQPQESAPRPAYTPNYSRPTRRRCEERENAFDALAWLLEGATGIVDELRHNDLGLSEEFWIHASAARRETLLAMHAALESIIEKTNAAEKEQQARATRRERRGGIEIDF